MRWVETAATKPVLARHRRPLSRDRRAKTDGAPPLSVPFWRDTADPRVVVGAPKRMEDLELCPFWRGTADP